MEDSTKKILIIIGGAILIIVCGVGVWRFLASKKTGATQPAQPHTTAQQNFGSAPEKNTTQPNTAESTTPPTDSLDAQLKRTAIDFVSRFGTYSTDAPNANIKELRVSMGPTLGAWADARLKQPMAVYTTFTSVTTKALAAKIISKTTLTAALTVSTQRQFVGATPPLQYQTADVTLVAVNGVWLVDAVNWHDQNNAPQK